ncbi:Collagen type IV alpha-3-binding protein, variant 2 [Dermatophagoides farinae]|uniref:Ceramide transfer protein n=1 Tax=Dermatophagoides farinae TaxID=6954 RepID=A0A922HUD7_DERFA|nr:Collagen type IV alpha-3-binding protein, variant 2 [Dermatophagoides farinae]
MNQIQVLPEHPAETMADYHHQQQDHRQSMEMNNNNNSSLTTTFKNRLSSSSSMSSLSDSCNESDNCCNENNHHHQLHSQNKQLPPSPLSSMSGVLLKWTNYLHGWQQRYIVLEDGALSYYKSEDEKSFGCRGAITIIKANIKLHEIDECRFDIGVSDCVWYLRAPSVEECRRWVNAIQEHKGYYQSLDNNIGPSSLINGATLVSASGSLQPPPPLSSSSSSPSTQPLPPPPTPSQSSQPPSTTSSVVGYPINASDIVGLRRHESALSLSSITSCRSYKEQLSEMETFRTILYQQIKTLQHYFDSSLQSTNIVNEHLKRHRRHQSMNGFNYLDCNNEQVINSTTNRNVVSQLSSSSTSTSSSGISAAKNHDNIFVDFKKEAYTFKATTAGIITSLSNCIDLMTQREEHWKKRLEKEQQRRRKIEDQSKRLGAELEETRRALAELQFELQRNTLQPNKDKVILIGGPDYEEGPHSMIKEEEFFDAIDAALDRSDQQEEDMRQLKLQTMNLDEPLDVIPPERCDHPLWPEVERVTMDQLYYARLEVEDTPSSGGGNWELFAQDGELRLYKRELEIDGLVCDPLKAVHTVKGVTAHEVCHQFFSPDVRFDWENTLDSMKVVENINPNTLVFHQIHKRVWPAAQRDTVFWSHIRKIDADTLRTKCHPNSTGKKLPYNVWIVCNNSVDRPDVDRGGCLRMRLVVSMCCEMTIDPPVDDDAQITRDHLRCRIIYCSKINPGGWAPASVLRALYKREYPKFMKRFSQYCIDVYKDKPIML